MSDSAATSAASEPKKIRYGWVDHARGHCILLVVLVHVIRGLKSAGFMEDTAAVQQFDDWVVALWLGMFFAMSGLFIVRRMQKGFLPFLGEAAALLAYPYVIWVLLQSFVHTASSGFTNKDYPISQLWTMIYTAPFHFWFIYTLFLIMVIYAVLYKLRVPPIVIVAITFVWFLLQNNDPFGFLGWRMLHIVPRWFVYFAIGAWFGQSAYFPKLNEWPLSRLAVVSFVCVAGAIGLLMLGAEHWPVSLFAVTALGGINVATLYVIVDRYKPLPFLEYCGRISLQMYLSHVIFTAGMRTVLKVAGIENVLAHLSLGILAGVLGPAILVLITDRTGFYYLWTLKDPRKRTAAVPRGAARDTGRGDSLEVEQPADSAKEV